MAIALHSCHPPSVDTKPDLAGSSIPPHHVWVDLIDPSPAEVAYVERATGLQIPSRA